MPSIVNRKFNEWTDDLDIQKSMVAIFEHIRDIPYSLAVPMHDPVTAPEQILLLGRGSCAPKHYLLAEMYRKLNLSVVYATFPFLWNDPDIRYPSDLRKLAEQLPVAYHLACRVQVGCRWVLVDATWDPPLKHAGFPVNEHWDGYSDMNCAVKPLTGPVHAADCRTQKTDPCQSGNDSGPCCVDSEKDHWEAEDRARYYQLKTSLRTRNEMQKTRKFHQKMEAWFAELRQSKEAVT